MADVKCFLYEISSKAVRNVPKEKYMSKSYMSEYSDKDTIWETARKKLAKASDKDVKTYNDVRYLVFGRTKNNNLLIFSTGTKKLNSLQELYNIEQPSANENREEIAIKAFEKVRQSGVTNMFARDVVCKLAKISNDEYMNCITNYDKLIKKYKVSRG